VIVLDTHAWLWWVSHPAKLGPRARSAIEAADRLGVPSISLWELAMLAVRGRIALDRPVADWLRQALALPRIEALHLTVGTAVAAAALEHQGFPGDPADRMIYATAREAGVPLVTRDERITAFDPARAVW
jgi:PIN domain nuclease of toxin-antitoxin system